MASRPLLVSSVIAITETSEVSLTRLMNCPASAGSALLLGQAVDATVNAGANQVHGISFGLDDPTAAENAARMIAGTARSMGIEVIG